MCFFFKSLATTATKQLCHIESCDDELSDEDDLCMVVMVLVAMVTIENVLGNGHFPYLVCLLHGYITNHDLIL